MAVYYLQTVGPYQPGDVGGAGSVDYSEQELIDRGLAERVDDDESTDQQEEQVDYQTTESQPGPKSDPAEREQLADMALKTAVGELPWQGEGDIRGLSRRVQSEVGDDGPDGRAREDYEAYLLDHPDVTRRLMED